MLMSYSFYAEIIVIKFSSTYQDAREALSQLIQKSVTDENNYEENLFFWVGHQNNWEIFVATTYENYGMFV